MYVTEYTLFKLINSNMHAITVKYYINSVININHIATFYSNMYA